MVTLPQEKTAARAAAGILIAGGVGLGVARNQAVYQALAPRVGRAAGRLRKAGAALHRDSLVKSLLFDEAVFARAMLRCLRVLAEAHWAAVHVCHGRQLHVVVAAEV